MVQTRCRFFDENGIPQGGGCFQGDRCKFIHPDNPAWETAYVRSSTRGRGMGRGGSFGESRGSFTRGRGRGSAPVHSYNSSSALGWDTGGGSDSNAQSQSSGWAMSSSKDSVKPAGGDIPSLWGTDDAWGLNPGAKESSSTGGWGDTDSWGGNSGTKDSSAGGTGEPSSSGWGNPSSSDNPSGAAGTTDMTSHVQEKRNTSETKESSAVGWGDSFEWGKPSGARGAAGATEMTSRTEEKPSRSEAKESSAGGWGSSNAWNGDGGTMDTSSSGWGNPSGGDKSFDGWGASGTTEMTSLTQSKRNDADQENYKSKAPSVPPPRPPRRGSRAQYDEEETRPLKMTGTNDVPMTNTRWNKKLDMTAPSHAESSERPRVPPLQSSALNNSMPREQPAPLSANRSEDGRTYVENWQRNTLPENPRSGSPSLSIVTGSTINRKRKHGASDLERQQENWKDFIRLCDRAVRAKVDLAKAEVERQNWRRAQKSATYSRIGEAGRIRLDGHRAELEKICTGHSDKLSQAIRELAETGDKLKSGIDYDRRYDIGDEVTSYLNEVGAWLSDIRPLLIAHTPQHPPNTNQPTPPHEDVGPPEAPPTILDGLDPVRSRLDKQEELLEELRTALTLESSKHPMATINDRIDKKLDTLREARAEAKAQRAKLPPPKVDIPPEAMGAIEDVSRQATELSAALEAPINDIAQLLIRQDEMQKTQASFKTENEELRESIVKLTETSAANRKLIQEQTEAIQRLKASLEAVSESRRTPPPAEPPVKVMFDDLRGAVDDAVQAIISREVVPTMKELTDQCRSENKRIHRELFEIIWDLIEPGLKVTEAVNRWVTSLELPAS